MLGPAGQQLEIWVDQFTPPEADIERQILIIKFPGTGGRAENSTLRPADQWTRLDSVMWTVNPFGYGGSDGRATLQRFPEMIERVLAAAQAEHPQRSLVVVGNSLGTLSALALAAQTSVAGVYLRNPVPLHQLITLRPRYRWPSLGLSRWLSSTIPDAIDGVANAGGAQAPALVLMSLQDRLVPPDYQRLITDPYAGPSRLLGLEGADHHDPVPESQLDDWQEGLGWLEDQICQGQH